MPRVTCRCGEKLKVPTESPEHMDCTRCGARIRLRRAKPQRNQSNAEMGSSAFCVHAGAG